MTSIKHNTIYTAHSFFQRGQAVIIAVVFFLIGSLVIVTGISSPVLREISEVRTLMESKQSFYTAESGVEDVFYRLKYGVPVSDSETITLATSTASVTTDITLDDTEIVAIGDKNDKIRTIRTVLLEGIGVSFFYGVESDVGGIQLDNQSKILGNGYSNGPIDGSGSNLIDGDAISTGPSGLVKEVLVAESVWAHNIDGATIGGDAFFGCPTCISGSSVTGTKTDDSDDQPIGSMPISDAWIDSWEQVAEMGGVITSADPLCSGGTYDIDSDTTLGPVKIECNLVLKGTGSKQDDPTTLTLAGDVWVVGDIEFTNTIRVTVADSLGAKSVVMIADDPADRLTSSKIIVRNSFFADHPISGSHILLISRNSSSKNGGSEIAIEVQQSAEGDFLVYSNEGEIRLQNNATLSEVSAYKIHLKNKAQVIYETGLRNLLFDSGPSGGFAVKEWGEI